MMTRGALQVQGLSCRRDLGLCCLLSTFPDADSLSLRLNTRDLMNEFCTEQFFKDWWSAASVKRKRLAGDFIVGWLNLN